MNKKYSIYIDEAGRGPLAGPVFVGLVVPLSFFHIDEFQDSKIVSPKKRELLYIKIKELEKENKIIYSFGSASNKEIDKYGISKSINLSICRGLLQLFQKLYLVIQKTTLLDFNDGKILLSLLTIQSLLNKKIIDEITLKNIIIEFDKIIQLKGIFIDGNTDFDIRNSTGKKVTTIIDGDAKNKYISMASIIAKQERDEFMEKLTDDYSKFSFYKHKGYGTKDHINNIVLYGVCDLHRITYLKKLMIRETINTNMYGDLEKINNIPIIYKQDKTLRRRKPSILIHICCVPDLTFPLKLLKKHFKVYLIWFNPNIQKDDEHNLRLSQLDKLLGNDGGKYSLVETSEIGKEFNEILYENRSIIDDFELLGKNEFIKTISKIPEYGKRCDICYYFRILEVGKVAESLRIDYFTTTLSISPKKNITKINKYGKLVGEKLSYSKFLFFDFRKDGGYIQSVKLTKKYGIYRQNYCGCNYSKKL